MVDGFDYYSISHFSLQGSQCNNILWTKGSNTKSTPSSVKQVIFQEWGNKQGAGNGNRKEQVQHGEANCAVQTASEAIFLDGMGNPH